MDSIDSPTHTQEDCVESDLCTLNGYGGFGCSIQGVAWARSDQDSIRAAGVASSLIRKTGVKEVMLGQTFCAAYVHMYKV
eukprot:1158456-Pelagomonas_calceolata.AAC.10